jgi:hypothetical protein
MTSLAGTSQEEVLQSVREALDAKSLTLLEEILRQVQEYREWQKKWFPNDREDHGFIRWLDDLKAGEALLPAMIPPAVIVAWYNGHARYPTSPSGPMYRCFRCGMVLPSGPPAAFQHPWPTCPVCGFDVLLERDRSRFPAAAWWRKNACYVIRDGLAVSYYR